MVRRWSAKTAWWTFFNIFVSSARGRAATTQLVFNTHFPSFEAIKPLVLSCFTHGFILKSFLEHCDSFNCSFSQKETKFHTQTHTHTHILFFKISHFNLKKSSNTLADTSEKMTWSPQCSVTWQTSSEYRRLAVPSGRTLTYVSFARKIQIAEIFVSPLLARHSTVYEVSLRHNNINLLKTKRNLLYIRN